MKLLAFEYNKYRNGPYCKNPTKEQPISECPDTPQNYLVYSMFTVFTQEQLEKGEVASWLRILFSGFLNSTNINISKF